MAGDCVSLLPGSQPMLLPNKIGHGDTLATLLSSSRERSSLGTTHNPDKNSKRAFAECGREPGAEYGVLFTHGVSSRFLATNPLASSYSEILLPPPRWQGILQTTSHPVRFGGWATSSWLERQIRF